MDLFVRNSPTVDTRITLLTLQLEDGSIEQYPTGSFTFEYLIQLQEHQTNIITHTSCTPNTFITKINNAQLFSMLGVIAKGGVGISSGFFFYESTIWLKKKKQKEQTPFFYNLQTINIFNNIRWVFIDEFTTTQIHSNSSAMPASVWPERELQDMYTVNFYGLQDTRRLLLDYKTVRGVLSPNLKISGLNHYSSFYDLYYI